MKLKLLIFFLITSFYGIGQNQSKIDDLTLRLGKVENDSIKSLILIDLAWEWMFSDPAKAEQYAKDAESVLFGLNFQKGNGDYQVLIGNLKKNRDGCSSAEKHFEEAFKIRTKLEDHKGVVSCYNNLGRCAVSRGSYQQAVEWYQQGLLILETKLTDPRLESKLRNNLAYALLELGQHNSALEQTKKSITLCNSIDNVGGKAAALLNQGIVYEKLKNYALAKQAYEKGIPLFERISAKHQVARCYINLANVESSANNYVAALNAFQQAEQYVEILPSNEQAIYYQNAGVIFNKLNQPEKGASFLLNSLDLQKNQGNQFQIGKTSYNLGNAYYDLEKYPEALEYYQKATAIIDTTGQDLQLKTNLSHNISKTYAKLNDFESAYKYENIATLLIDSLKNQNETAIVAERNLMAATKRNQLLQKDKQLQRTIIMGLIFGGIASIGLLFLAFLNYRNRQLRVIAQQNEQISKQDLLDLIQKQDLKTAYARLEGQDAERTRIAENLHDSVGSILSTVKMYFKAFNTPEILSDSEKKQQFKLTNELLDKAAEEVRNVSHNLEAVVLKKFGLEKQLRSLADTLRNSKQLAVDVIVNGLKDRLDGVTEIKIYRIIQELVNNTIKHANADKLIIQLVKHKQGGINITVEDDGKGFDVKKAEKKGGMGMDNIRSRLHDLSGTLQIDSSEKSGTIVIIDIPTSL